ncbi:hypothetical protein ACIBF1_44335 [Spirillospora sp. NPDC050679]
MARDGVGQRGPDPSRARTWDELVAALKEVRLRAGTPSFRELERRAGKSGSVPLSRTQVSKMLKGGSPPNKARMLSFLSACGVPGPALASWSAAWEELAVADQAQRAAAQAPVAHQEQGPAVEARAQPSAKAPLPAGPADAPEDPDVPETSVTAAEDPGTGELGRPGEHDGEDGAEDGAEEGGEAQQARVREEGGRADLVLLEQLRQREQEQHERVRQLQAEVAHLRGQLSRAYQQLTDQRREAARKLAAAQAGTAPLQEQIDRLTAAGKRLEGDLKQRGEELGRARQALKREQQVRADQRREAERKLAAAQADNTALQSQVAQLTGANEQLEEELWQARDELDRQQQARARQQQEAERELAAAWADNTKLQQQARRLDAAVRQLEELEGVRHSLVQEQKASERTRAELAQARAQQQEAGELRSSIDHLQALLRVAEELRVAAERRANQLQQRLDDASPASAAQPKGEPVTSWRRLPFLKPGGQPSRRDLQKSAAEAEHQEDLAYWESFTQDPPRFPWQR